MVTSTLPAGSHILGRIQRAFLSSMKSERRQMPDGAGAPPSTKEWSIYDHSNVHAKQWYSLIYLLPVRYALLRSLPTPDSRD